MEPDAWFAQLLAATAPADAAVPGVRDEVGVTDAERDALLDLARIAAHTSERWTAPVSTFLVGLRYADLTPGVRAAALRSLVDDLDDPDAG